MPNTRPTPERILEIRRLDQRPVELCDAYTLREYTNAVSDLLAELDARAVRIAELEAQVEAAFPVVPDGQTKITLAVLDVVASGQKPLSEGGARATAKLITRLATERTQYQEAMQTYSGAMTKALQAQKRMEEALERIANHTDPHGDVTLADGSEMPAPLFARAALAEQKDEAER